MKLRIAVFFGGASVEHEISVISAVQAMRVIDRNQYDVVPVYMTQDGLYYTGDELFTIENFKDISALLKHCSRVVPMCQAGCAVLFFCEGVIRKKPIPFDMAFPIVHGTNCEDGSLQGLFELLQLPYVGCDVTASAIGMDKVVTKMVLKEAGLPVLPYCTFSSREWLRSRSDIEKKTEVLGWPLIVKPVNLGSSVGISKVNSADELAGKIDEASQYATRLLLEPAVQNLREINCSVLGDSDEAQASVLEEPVMHDEILSYGDKYLSGSSGKGMSGLTRRLPAELPAEVTEKIRSLALSAFHAAGCSGVVRIDFLTDSVSGEVFINELNTIPGSLAFYLWEASGLSYPQLIDRLISIASRRDRTRKQLCRSYDTNILQNSSFGSKGGKLKK